MPDTVTGHMSIILSNSLDPDRVRQNVGPNLDPSCLSDDFNERMVLKDQHESS